MLARTILVIAGLVAAGPAGAAAEPPAGEPETAPAAAPAPEEKTLFDFTMTTIDGEEKSLREYEGKVVLVVNVASKCGLTPQYEALERLYEEKKDAGLVVLGFPANNFGGQEPGTNEEILAFCTERYEVTFPMFAKISVKGKGQHAMYEWLTSHPAAESAENKEGADAAVVGGEIAWNFTKFLFGPDGKPVARFEPRTTPDDPALVGEVEALLEALPSTREGKADAEETAAP